MRVETMVTLGDRTGQKWVVGITVLHGRVPSIVSLARFSTQPLAIGIFMSITTFLDRESFESSLQASRVGKEPR